MKSAIGMGIITVGVAAVLWASPVLAWDDCPLGEVNDPAPGECSRYVDTDSNGICDHSEPAPQDRLAVSTDTASATEVGGATLDLEVEKEALPELSGRDLKTKTVAEVADFYSVTEDAFIAALSDFLGITVKVNDTFQLLHDNYGMEPSAVKDIVLSVKNNSALPEASTTESPTNKSEKDYFFGPIAIILTIIYLVSFILSKLKTISVAAHRRVWNVMLLVTFLVSGLLGVSLTIRINYGINVHMPFNILFWHVEAGIAMTLISLFHILWHLPYYKAIFVRKSS